MNLKATTIKNPGRGARAFTLVEVMVSVGLLGIMMAAVYPAFVLGFASIKTTREDERATQIVTQKIEGFRLLTWSSQYSCPTSFVDYYNPAGQASGAAGALYTGTITITTNLATVDSYLISNGNIPTYDSLVRVVKIGVTWVNYVDKAPITHKREMETLSAYYGLQNYLYGNTTVAP